MFECFAVQKMLHGLLRDSDNKCSDDHSFWSRPTFVMQILKTTLSVARRPCTAEVGSEAGTCMLLDANVPGLARDGLPLVAPVDPPSSSFSAQWRPSLRNPAAIAVHPPRSDEANRGMSFNVQCDVYPPRSGEANRGKSVHSEFGVQTVS